MKTTTTTTTTTFTSTTTKVARTVTAITASLITDSNHQTCTNIPCIEIEGIPFYSDRFYLHRTIYDDDDDDDARGPFPHRRNNNNKCHCGVKHPLPLFDRAALIQSLNLKAVIWSTYTMEPEAWASEYPTLFGPDATIPTLVMHGKKGWTWNEHTQQQQQQQQQQSVDDEDSIIEEEDVRRDDESIATQPPDPTIRNHPNKHNYHTFPETVHFSEITTSWIPPNDLARVSRIIDDETGCLSPELLAVRKSCKGVHHPKYMLLFETSGALIVVVSTANMTTSRTIDASWMQRFPPLDRNENTPTPSSSSSDFGLALAHFMQHQMLSTRANQMTLTTFLQRNVGWKSLRDLLRLYSFDEAQVHLMPIVPGIFPLEVPSPHPVPPKEESKKKTPVFFGQQRMAQVLQQLTEGKSPWIPPSLLSDHDRLLCQPTSLGAEWTVEQMSSMVHAYLGHAIPQRPQVVMLKRLDIIWPTDYYVQQVKAVIHESATTTTPFIPNAFPTEDSSHASSQLACSGYLFLSSETFNRIPIDCLSQMVLWEPCYPSPQKTILVPHIKSIARVFHGNDYRIRKDYGIPKCEELFSWFLLTSACLSRGAQGVCIDQAMHYANFELGVLFSCRLDAGKKRLYGWKPSHCVCRTKENKTASTARLIHLPLPYCVRPPRYQEDEEEMEFCETPYFHEVTPGSVAVGNMRFTPYGAAMAEKLAKKDIV
jgi:hypothetical protein